RSALRRMSLGQHGRAPARDPGRAADAAHLALGSRSGDVRRPRDVQRGAMSRVFSKLAVAVAVLAGCGSYSTYKTTGIVPPSETQWLFGLQVAGAGTAGAAQEASTASKNLPLPELARAVRHALDERFELQ